MHVVPLQQHSTRWWAAAQPFRFTTFFRFLAVGTIARNFVHLAHMWADLLRAVILIRCWETRWPRLAPGAQACSTTRQQKAIDAIN
jgi:hypothetical protein